MRVHMYIHKDDITEYLKGEIIRGFSNKETKNKVLYVHVDVPAEDILSAVIYDWDSAVEYRVKKDGGR